MKTLLFWLLLTLVGFAETLQLEEVLRQVQLHHPKLRATELLNEMAQAKVLEKEGAFDPSLVAGSDFLRYQSPTAPGKAKLADDHMVGVQIQDVAGWKLISGYRRNQGDVKSPDNLTGDGGEFFLEFKLPLLRGLGTNEKQTALEQARLGIDLTRALTRVVRLEVLLSASIAYWDWAAACTDLRLLQASVKLAQERAEQVEARVKAGDLPRIDATEAQQEVQRRLEVVAKASRQVEKTAFKLSLYLWNTTSGETRLPSVEAAPALFPSELASPWLGNQTTLVRSELQESDLSRAELESLQWRPELSHLQFERKVVELDAKLAENDRLPALDLTLGPGLDTGFRSVGLTYKVGLQLTVPLATRTADGRLQGARLKNDKLQLDQVLEIQRILTEVRDAFSLGRTSQQRLQPALRSLELALKLEQAERARFSLGDSTLFLINQRERASLAEAQKLVEIWADSCKSRSLLEAAAGRL